MSEDVRKNIMDHKFTNKLSLNDKICVLVFYICKTKAIPLVLGDICRVFSKTRGVLLKLVMHEFKLLPCSKAYCRNVFERFSGYLRSIGTEMPDVQAYGRFIETLEIYPSSSLELVAVSILLEGHNYEDIYKKSNLEDFFTLGALRCFIKKLKRENKSKRTEVGNKNTLCKVFAQIRGFSQ